MNPYGLDRRPKAAVKVTGLPKTYTIVMILLHAHWIPPVSNRRYVTIDKAITI